MVLAEATRVLDTVYGLDPQAIATSVKMLLKHEHLILQDPETVAAAVGHLRARPTLGFSDCLMLEVARRAGHLPLGTFDRPLGRLDGAEQI